MKAFDQFFVVVVFAAFLPFFAQAQPCLRMYSESFTVCAPPVPSTYLSVSNLVEFNVTEPTAGLDAYPNLITNPRYKAFWIWGDGNFLNLPNTPVDDALSLHQDYSYSAAGTYNPIAVLIEKKSNTSPPPSLTREIEIPSPLTNTAAPFITTLVPGKFVNISHSEKNRPDYPTAFVVSAERNNASLIGMFFFFNRIKPGGSGTVFQPDIVHSLETSSINQPKYYENTPMAFELVPDGLPALSLNLNPAFIAGVDQVYNHFIYAPIDANIRNAVPPNFSEIRFFPLLKTTWDSTWLGADSSMPVSQYMAVSVGRIQRFTNDDADSKDYLDFRKLVSGVFPGISGPAFQISSDPELYIRDIDILDVELALAIDPNELEVTQVCPFERDSFQVKMRLQVCNEGAMHVSNFTFRLIDHSNRLGQPEFTGNHDVQFLAPINTHQWQFKWNTYLDGVPLPDSGVPHDEALTCATAEFVLNTDWQGVEALAAGGALEVCVTFPYVRDTCSLNFGFKDFCREKGYRCGDCPKEQVCATFCCHWLWLLAILVVIVLLVQLWTLWVVKRN